MYSRAVEIIIKFNAIWALFVPHSHQTNTIKRLSSPYILTTKKNHSTAIFAYNPKLQGLIFLLIMASYKWFIFFFLIALSFSSLDKVSAGRPRHLAQASNYPSLFAPLIPNLPPITYPPFPFPPTGRPTVPYVPFPNVPPPATTSP